MRDAGMLADQVTASTGTQPVSHDLSASGTEVYGRLGHVLADRASPSFLAAAAGRLAVSLSAAGMIWTVTPAAADPIPPLLMTMNPKDDLTRKARENPGMRLPQEQRARLRQLFTHLEALASDTRHNLIARATFRQVKALWRIALYCAGPSLTVPAAANGPGGEVLLRWTGKNLLLEAEVRPTGQVEWSFLDRVTEESWERSFKLDAPLNSEVVGTLRRIARLRANR